MDDGEKTPKQEVQAINEQGGTEQTTLEEIDKLIEKIFLLLEGLKPEGDIESTIYENKLKNLKAHWIEFKDAVGIDSI